MVDADRSACLIHAGMVWHIGIRSFRTGQSRFANVSGLVRVLLSCIVAVSCSVKSGHQRSMLLQADNVSMMQANSSTH